jgi:hypothetical protein
MTDNDWVSSFPDYKARKAAADARRKPATEAAPEPPPTLKPSANSKFPPISFLLEPATLVAMFCAGLTLGFVLGSTYQIQANLNYVPNQTTTKP